MDLLFGLMGGGHHHHHHHHHGGGMFGYGRRPSPFHYHGGWGGHHHHHHGGGLGLASLFFGAPCHRIYGGYSRPPPVYYTTYTSYNSCGGGPWGGGYGGGFGGFGGGGMCYRSINDSSALQYRGGVRPIKPYTAPVPYTQGRVKGLFIGINYYGTAAELRGCCNDVAVMLDTLKQIEFPLEEAAILVDDPSFAGASGLPTRDNIIQHMLWLVKDAKAGDVLLFCYSGHGGQTRDLDGDEEDGKDETMIPVDFKTAGTIVDDDIFEILVRNLPEGVRMTAVMDCCHSGTLMDLPYSFEADGNPNRTLMGGGRGTLMRQSRGDVVMFSGCADHQKSVDVSNTRTGFVGNSSYGAGGACTNALAMVLTRTRGLTFAQLLEEMRKVLVSRKYGQTPLLSSSKPVDLSQTFSLFGTFRPATHFVQTPGNRVVPFVQAPPPQQQQQPPPPQAYPPRPPPQQYPQQPPQQYAQQQQQPYVYQQQPYQAQTPPPAPPPHQQQQPFVQGQYYAQPAMYHSTTSL